MIRNTLLSLLFLLPLQAHADPTPTPSPTPPPSGGLLPNEVPPFPVFSYPAGATHKNLVADFGAKPNDAGDDTAAFTAAVNYARSHTGFEVLDIPFGTYLLTRGPTYEGCVKVDGVDGFGMETLGGAPGQPATWATIKLKDGTGKAGSHTKMFSSGVQGSPVKNLRVRYLVLDGNVSTMVGGEQSHGWDFAKSSDIMIEHVACDAIRGDCLRFQRGTTGVSLRKLEFRKKSGRSAIGIQAAVSAVRMEDIHIDASFVGSDQRLDFEPTGTTSETGPHHITIVRWVEDSASTTSEFSFTLSGIPGSNPITNAQDLVIRDSIILGGVNMRNNRNVLIYNTTIDVTHAKAKRCVFINGRTAADLLIQNSRLKCDGPAIDARHHGSTGRPRGLRILNSTLEAAQQAIYGETTDDIEITDSTLRHTGSGGDAVFLNGIRQDGSWGKDTDLRHVHLTRVRLEGYSTGLSLTGRGTSHWSDVIISDISAFNGASPYRVTSVPAQVVVVP